MSRPYEVRVEPEYLAWRTIIAVLIVGIGVIIACAAVVKGSLPRSSIESAGGLGGAPEQLGTLEVRLFPEARAGLQRQDAQRDELDRFSWVDRDAGVIAIPIDRAMRLLVEKNR